MHKQIQLQLHGRPTRVDKGVHELVLLLNQISRIETYNSCGGSDNEKGYVHFGGPRALVLLPALVVGIQRQQSIWRMKHRHICNGCSGMSLTLQVDCAGTFLRWFPRDYQKVITAVKAAKKL
jgi:hypothetical protein